LAAGRSIRGSSQKPTFAQACSGWGHAQSRRTCARTAARNGSWHGGRSARVTPRDGSGRSREEGSDATGDDAPWGYAPWSHSPRSDGAWRHATRWAAAWGPASWGPASWSFASRGFATRSHATRGAAARCDPTGSQPSPAAPATGWFSGRSETGQGGNLVPLDVHRCRVGAGCRGDRCGDDVPQTPIDRGRSAGAPGG
jgi:hypothetical protein